MGINSLVLVGSNWNLTTSKSVKHPVSSLKQTSNAHCMTSHLSLDVKHKLRTRPDLATPVLSIPRINRNKGERRAIIKQKIPAFETWLVTLPKNVWPPWRFDPFDIPRHTLTNACLLNSHKKLNKIKMPLKYLTYLCGF